LTVVIAALLFSLNVLAQDASPAVSASVV